MSGPCSENLGQSEEASGEDGVGAGWLLKKERAFLMGIFVRMDGGAKVGCKCR